MVDKINHIGVVVRNLEQAMSFYCGTLGLGNAPIIEESDFRVCILEIGEIKFELLEPRNEESATGKFLKNRGEGLHHVCFEVDDIYDALSSLQVNGVALINDKPQRGAEGKIAFIHPRASNGVLIELVQVEEKTED